MNIESSNGRIGAHYSDNLWWRRGKLLCNAAEGWNTLLSYVGRVSASEFLHVSRTTIKALHPAARTDAVLNTANDKSRA